MPSFTSRMGLKRPAKNESMAIAGTDLAGNYAIVDKCAGAITTVSPLTESPLYWGRLVYQAQLLIYNATVPYFAKCGNLLKTHLGFKGSATASYPNMTNAEAFGPKLTFTVAAGRNYLIRISCSNRATVNATGNFVHRIRYAAGSNVTTADTLLEEQNWQYKQNSIYTTLSAVIRFPTGLSGTYTVGWSALTDTGGHAAEWYNTYFEIQDVGV